MSQSLAEKMRYKLSAKNITAILVFGAIVMVFVFFGMPQKMGAGMGAVARVNDTLISAADFKSEEQRIQRIQEYYAQMFGQPISFDEMRQKQLKMQAVQNLVQMELVSQASEAHGLAAIPAEIVDQIQETPEFQQNGQFQGSLYFRLLEANRLSPAVYESKIRKQVEQNRALKLFEIAAAPTSLELEKEKALKETQWNVAYVRVNADAIAEKMPSLESQAQKLLSQPDFAQKVEDEYKANLEEYKKQEKVQAQHLLLSVKPGDLEADRKALEKINELRLRAEKEDFGQLASQFSEDPGSKSKKGDLGFFGRGKMTPEFEKVAFSTAVGKISNPVKTEFGYHLIKVNQKSGAEFKDVQNMVAKKVLARQIVDEKSKVLQEMLTAGNESGLNSELKSLGLNWEETGYFDLGAEFVPKLEGDPAQNAVFRLSSQAPLSKEIVRSGRERYILKLKDTKMVADAGTTPQENNTLKQRRASQLMESWIEDYRRGATVEINQQMIGL